MTGGRRGTTPLAPLERDLAATAALALYSLAVGIGFARVFSGWDFLPHFLMLVIVGHGSSFAIDSGAPTEASEAKRPLEPKRITVSGDRFTLT